MAGDVINNHRTVASFGYDDVVVNQYDKLLDIPMKSVSKKAHIIGFVFGFS